MMDIKKLLEDHKKSILQIELCGLLHDIGKLSREFINYRQTWHMLENGWYKDPHPHILETDSISKVLSVNLKNIFDNLWIDTTIKYHEDFKCISDRAKNYFVQKINVADAIDAAHDRNNPLFSCEQTNRNEKADINKILYGIQVYRSNVYGFEEP